MSLRYAFILGRNPELSIAELGAVLGGNLKIPHHQAVVFFSGELPQTPQDFLNRLGGCVEILEIFEEKIPVDALEPAIVNFLKNKPGKIVFALNLVPENKKSKLLKFLLPRVKKSLQQVGRSAAFLNKDFQNVNAVAAVKQKLVESDTNVSVIDESEGKISLGYSVAMQDFEAYSKRDYGKPFRDPQSGMLPPKLAQIMVNLSVSASEAKQSSAILDPFCGTGTILMEALLMGYSVIGSDVDSRMVEGAKKNIDWLVRAHTTREYERARFYQKNATELTASDVIARPAEGLSKQANFVIVPEPYLGPPLSQFPAENFLKKLTADLEKLYLEFFKNLASWLPKSTPIVFVFPYWKKGSARQSLASPIVAKIESLGYSKTTFVPLQTASLFYDRPNSIVGREIVRFVKN
jgi:tRNA G10  N-methylase Trm11